jgi:hypothetical protein
VAAEVLQPTEQVEALEDQESLFLDQRQLLLQFHLELIQFQQHQTVIRLQHLQYQEL